MIPKLTYIDNSYNKGKIFVAIQDREPKNGQKPKIPYLKSHRFEEILFVRWFVGLLVYMTYMSTHLISSVGGIE